MNYYYLISGFIIFSLILYVIFKTSTNRAYTRGYRDSEIDMANKLISDSYWFSSEYKIFNTLFLMGRYIKDYGYYDISSLRDDVRRIGETKRVTDL